MAVEELYNCYGEKIDRHDLEYLDPSYGTFNENHIPDVNWGDETDECDKYGFDKKYRPIEGSDDYLIRNYELEVGTILCRYGYPGGNYTTVKGTLYEDLSLPYVKETVEYHEYKVVKKLHVKALVPIVDKGKVAPKFQSNGGAIQFYHYHKINVECNENKGFLKEDKSWLSEIEAAKKCI